MFMHLHSIKLDKTNKQKYKMTCASIMPPHDKTNKLAAPSEDSDQHGHSPSLIRVFTVRSVDSLRPKFSSCGQQRICSVLADAQADLSLRWAHMPFCWFCHEVAHEKLIPAWAPAQTDVRMKKFRDAVFPYRTQRVIWVC